MLFTLLRGFHAFRSLGKFRSVCYTVDFCVVTFLLIAGLCITLLNYSFIADFVECEKEERGREDWGECRRPLRLVE